MTESEWEEQPSHVADAWRRHRPYLVDLAFRMLGDIGRAEDVVQEAFSRLLRAPITQIGDERGWLIVVTSRLCLDQLRSATSRREVAQDVSAIDSGHRESPPAFADPADRVTLDDDVRLALLVVLERLSPAERVVFILHDIFQVPFEAIGETVGRSAATCRQLARRARQKIEDTVAPQRIEVSSFENRLVTEKFITACANGDLDGLLEVLDPDVSGELETTPLEAKGLPIARSVLDHWGPRATLVSEYVGNQPVLLGFVDQRLAGVISLSIRDGRVAKVKVRIDPAMLDAVRVQLRTELPSGPTYG